MLPPAKQNKKQKFETTFLESRRQALDVYLQNLVPLRPNIFGTKYTSGTFVKFISPTVLFLKHGFSNLNSNMVTRNQQTLLCLLKLKIICKLKIFLFV